MEKIPLDAVLSSSPDCYYCYLVFAFLASYQEIVMPPKPPLTHFLCLPLVTPSSKSRLLASLQSFIADATDLEQGNSATIPAKAIRPIGTLHLTLGVMSLQTPERVVAASDFLRSLNVPDMLYKAAERNDASSIYTLKPVNAKDISPGKADLSKAKHLEIAPLTITLSGLHPMHKPSSTSILYASPLDPTHRLYPFCLALQQAFINAGYLLSDDRDLRLHATIVNTIYAKDKKALTKRGGHGKTSKDSRKFDAQEVIDKYDGFEWAKDVHIERVSICEMGAKKIIDGGEVVEEEYLEISSVPLP